MLPTIIASFLSKFHLILLLFSTSFAAMGNNTTKIIIPTPPLIQAKIAVLCFRVHSPGLPWP